MRALWNVCRLAALMAVVLASACATTASADVGVRGFSYRDADHVEIPTADKPQSKLWFHDGGWWGLLYSTFSHATRIHRLDPVTQTWVDAGTAVDGRFSARADVLSEGDRLYVVSGTTVVSEWGNPPANAAVVRGSAELARYTYDPASRTYRLDPGFPVTVHRGSTESITLAKDSTGTLWVTYTQDGHVWVNRTGASDIDWGEPFVLPVPDADVHYDDISAVTSLDGAVGVMWSNQITRRFSFAVHRDGDPDTAWAREVAYGGGVGGCVAGCANDHLDVKPLTSDGSDRVFAAVKTANQKTGQPFIVLLVRDRHGQWSNTVFGTVEELHTRPAIAIDEEHRRLYMFAVAPETGGAIYYKETDVDAISFEPGPGTPFIQGDEDTDISNPTTTRQPVNSQTGLVVLASANANAAYWHNSIDLGRLPKVPPVVPGDPDVSLPAVRPESRLKLRWADQSVNESGFEIERKTAGGDFHLVATVGSGTVSYTDSRLSEDTAYSYRIRAVGAAGASAYSGEATATTAFVRTFVPRADATVDASAPRANLGSATALTVMGAPVFRQSDFSFDLDGLGGATVRTAKLRLYVTDYGGVQGGAVSATSPNDWAEDAITWNTRPAIVSPTLASLAGVETGEWCQLDVTPAVTGDGALGLRLRSTSADEVRYASREEGEHAPRLVVTLAR